jgi:hypothetical protein
MPDTPLDLFHHVTRRLNAEDWAGVADLCDPASLTEFHRNFLWLYTSDRRGALTPESYLQHSPDMPLAWLEP